MSAAKELTALEMLAYRSAAASRQAAEGRWSERAINYEQGKAFAYNEAHKLMTEELRRLCNLFQNGALSVSDFNVVL